MSNFIGSKSDKKMYRKFDEIYYNDSQQKKGPPESGLMMVFGFSDEVIEDLVQLKIPLVIVTSRRFGASQVREDKY